jgi:hypothetical protein
MTPAWEQRLADLDRGLGEDRRRQAVIQLASSLRNLGQAVESVALLTGEREAGGDRRGGGATVTVASA